MQCDSETCGNRLPDDVSSGYLSQSSASHTSLPEPHRNANFDTPRAQYSQMSPSGPETLSINGMPSGVVQPVSTPHTLNSPNAAETSGFSIPPSGDVPTWSKSPFVPSQYGPYPMENRIHPLTQTVLTPAQSYGYPSNQMSYGGPRSFAMPYTNPDGAYDYTHSTNVPVQTPWVYPYTPIAAQQPSYTTTAAPEFDYYPTASPSFGNNEFEPSFHNNFDNSNFDNNSRSVDEKTSKPSKAPLWAKIRAIFKFASRISSPKHQVQVEAKPVVLVAS